MKTKADGYYIQVKNNNGYPRDWVSLKITHEDTSRYLFGGGSSTRTAIFKEYNEARKVARKQVKMFTKKYNGSFEFIIHPIKIVKLK